MFRSQKGTTLPEAMVAVAIMGIIVFASLSMTISSYTLSKHNVDKEFATQKAISMLEELKTLVEQAQGSNVVLLDGYNDGDDATGIFRNRLTTQGLTTDAPDDAISGNRLLTSTTWTYVRQIQVQRFNNLADVRLVRVRVYRQMANNRGTIIRTPLAEVASVLQTSAITYPPSQTYDVYAIALENVPGWWVALDSLQPMVSGAINSLQSRNPGLVFRTHWITKLSYGRDGEYKPYVNGMASTNPPNSQAQIDRVYFYPGYMPPTYTDANGTAAASPINYYYVPQNFRARMATDVGEVNGYSAANSGNNANPNPYALADQFNHSLRYPDEKALYDARRTVTVDGTATGAKVYPNEEPTFRLLIEDMYMHPAKYRNAIVINLHGELFPFPPVRNFSDAAKIPDVLPNVRVVTHPENIEYTNSQAISLRVYAYLSDPAVAGNNVMDRPISLTLKGINWPGPTVSGSITGITGGVDLNGDGLPDTYQSIVTPTLPTSDDPGAPAVRRMYYTVTAGTCVGVGCIPDTIIQLYNTPLRTPCSPLDCNGKGLAPSARLYGLEYIPSPLEAFDNATAVTPFSRRIDTFNGPYPKNTARWVINLPTSVLTQNSVFRFETRIGTDLTTGTLFPTRNQPTNLSATYVWRGTDGSVVASDNWLYGTAASDPNFPITERYQYIGDPRHSPYADNKKPHTTNSNNWAAANAKIRIGLGYNRYFDDFEDESGNAAAATPIPTSSTTAKGAIIGSSATNFNITAGSPGPPLVPPNNTLVVNFTGLGVACNGVVATITLPTGASVSRNAVVLALNNEPTFAACGTASAVTRGTLTFIQLESDFSNYASSMQIDTSASTAATLLGFDGKTVNGENPGTFTIQDITQTATPNNRLVVIFSGGTCDGTIANIGLTSGTRSAAQIVTDINANGTFAACGTAQVYNNAGNYVQLITDANANAMMVDTASSTAATTLGFGPWIVGVIPWPGWKYTAGGTTYGVKNDGTIDNDKWQTGTDTGIELDENRIHQTWRNTLQRANAVYTTMTGFSYYYNGIGNEIGADASNNFATSLPVNARPFTGLNANTFEQSITDSVSTTRPTGVKYIAEGDALNNRNNWWSINWLGELYPDNRYDAAGTNDWVGYGNLPTGISGTNGAGTFRRILRQSVDSTPPLVPPWNNNASKWYTYGSRLLVASRRSGDRGSTNLFSAGSTTATFRHEYCDGSTSTLRTAGTQIQSAYSAQIDNTTPSSRPFYVNAASPYQVNFNGTTPDDFLESEYGAAGAAGFVNAGGVQSEFYRLSANCNGVALPSSGLLYDRDPNNLANTTFIVVNGLSPAGTVGANYIANWAFITLIESFFWGGVYSDGGTAPNTTHVAQLPQVVITSPNATTDITNPSTPLSIQWAENWKRWDGRKYIPQYSNTFSECTSCNGVLTSYVMYSVDGATWKYIQNDQIATPGVRPIQRNDPPTTADTSLETAVAVNGSSTSTTWDITNPTTFPEGTYIIRVETYRSNIPLHYSYHQYRIFINRG